jgi:sigma-B regulation protein RsbU (phosphoserine phosphatase)
MPILIVEREMSVRLFLIRLLESNNFLPILAESASDALEVIRSEGVKLVLCDWDGENDEVLNLCRRIRTEMGQSYVYVIVQSIQSDKDAIIQAMEAGADDFVSKPVNAHELLVRIKSSSRVIELQDQLVSRNQTLEFAHKRMSDDYDQLTTELMLASKMQANLLPDPKELRNTYATWMFKPANFLAGDMFDYFMVSDNLLAFYVIDVEGHGITSALTSFLVDNMLNPSRDGLCRRMLENSIDVSAAVVNTVTELNKKFSNSDMYTRYFSMIYGMINTDTGRVTLTQAGHPFPIRYDAAKGCTQKIGDGGVPVGILTDVSYEPVEFTLNAGDRLYLYSDGVTECMSPDGEMFETPRLEDCIGQWHTTEVEEVHTEFERVFRRWNGDSKPFEDDLSLICFEYRGTESQLGGVKNYGI